MADRARAIEAWLAASLPGPWRRELAFEDASVRRYFRVRAGGQSFVVMDAPPEKIDARPFVELSARLAQAGLNVPRVERADPEQGLFLLTDLGARPYARELDAETAARLYADAIGALLTLQACVSSEGLPLYDKAFLLREMRLFEEWFLHRHVGLAVTRAERAGLEQVFSLLLRSAGEQPQVFVHRDYHSRNLMLCPGHNPGILDFQDAVRGPLTYDLVSLLRDVYVEWPQSAVERWRDSYRALALERGLLEADEPEVFRRWFDWMGLQRHLKIAGLFARLHHRDDKSAYLEHLPLTVRYLRSVAGRYPEMRALSALLRRLPP